MRRIALGAVVAAAALATLVTSAAPQQRGRDPERVVTRSDPGKAKLDDSLRQRVDDGSTAQVYVFVTVSGDAARVRALLDDDAAAQRRGNSLVVGRIGTQAVQKVASLKNVVSVGLVQLSQTGKPLGDPDPLIGETKIKGLWVNSGHGHLGWTLSCGSGRVAADLINGRDPGIPLPPAQGVVARRAGGHF